MLYNRKPPRKAVEKNMRLNQELIQTILEIVEENADGTHPAFPAYSIASHELIPDSQYNEALYFIRMLIRDGFLEGSLQGIPIDEKDDVFDITTNGRDFLFVLRNPSLVESVKKHIGETGMQTLNFFFDIAKRVLVSAISADLREH